MSCGRWKLLVALLISPAFAEETVTDNLINGTWSTSGSVLDHTYSDGSGHIHLDYQGGSITQTIDLTQYTGQLEYNYTTSVYACENQIGGHCSSGRLDTFTVTLTTDAGDTWTDTYYVGDTWQDIDITYTPTADASTADLTLYGVDNGFWAGWYGPVAYTGSFTVRYDPTLTEVIMPAANPELQTVLPTDPTTDPSMGTISPNVGTVEVAPVAQVEVAPPPPQPQQQAQPQQTAQASPQPQPKASGKSSSKVSVQTVAGVVSANVEASAQSVSNAFGDPNSPVAQAVMLSLMASNGVSLEDVSLPQPKLPKPPTMRDRRFEDRFWLDSLRSEARFQKHMVDAQWQK
jgi:hypothetical protein